MVKQIIFDCKVTNYKIEYLIQDDKCLMNTIVTDYKHMKPLLSLIRNSIDNLKKMDIKIVVQYVSVEEWDKYLKDKTTWKIVNKDDLNQVVMVECSINDFLENYGKGVGIL